MSDLLNASTIAMYERLKRSRWIFFSLAYGLIGLIMGMDSTYDLRNYHFFDPYWVFSDGMRGIAPGGSQSFLNPLISAPFYFGPRYLNPMLFQFLIGAIQGISGPILYLIARELKLSKPLSLLTAICGMFASTALSEVGNSQGDTLIAPLLLGAVLILLRVANYPTLSKHRRSAMILGAGLLTGGAVGLKETVVCVGVGVGFLTLALARDLRESFRMGLLLSAGILAGYVLTYGWWAIVLWVKFGSPFFPLYNQIILSPWAAPVINVGYDRSLHSIVDMILYPFRILLVRSTVPKADYPYGYITGVVGFRQMGFPVLEVLFGATLIAKVRDLVLHRRFLQRPSSHLGALSAFFLSSYLLWCVTTGIYRYVVVLEMLTPVLIILAIKYIGEQTSWPRFAVPVAVVLVLLIAFTQRIPNWGRTPFTSNYFTMKVPSVLNQHDVAIVIVSDSPSSFVIPSFDQKPLFIRSGSSFPLQGKMLDQAHLILKDAHHVFVMWGDSPLEDTLTWQAMQTTTVPNYPLFLQSVGLGSTSTNCGEFDVNVNGSIAPFHYCQIR